MLVRRNLSLPRVAMIRRFTSSSTSDVNDILVVINGLPGPMALETGKACIDRGLKIATSALTGPSSSPQSLEIKVEARMLMKFPRRRTIKTSHFLNMCFIFSIADTIFVRTREISSKFITMCNNEIVERFESNFIQSGGCRLHPSSSSSK